MDVNELINQLQMARKGNELVISSFGKWLYYNQLIDIVHIKQDILRIHSNTQHSLILNFFANTNNLEMFDILVNILNNYNNNDHYDHHHYNHYNQNTDPYSSDNSYSFGSDDLGINLTLLELVECLQSLELTTQYAVWHKIPKNEDDVIGNPKDLLLCIHVLICIAIQNKYSMSDDSTLYPNGCQYDTFIETIVNCLCSQFLNRNQRMINAPDCLSLKDNESKSPIVMGFGDLVESLPIWLFNVNQIIISQKQQPILITDHSNIKNNNAISSLQMQIMK